MNEKFWITPAGDTTIRIVGHPLTIWQEWEDVNGKKQCHSFPTKTKTGVISYLIPVVLMPIIGTWKMSDVLLWRVGKLVMSNLNDLANDPSSGNGKWDWFFEHDIKVNKIQGHNGPWPITTVRPAIQVGSVVRELTAQEEGDLFAEFWKSTQQPVQAKDIKEKKEKPKPARDEKVIKILKQIGYGNSEIHKE